MGSICEARDPLTAHFTVELQRRLVTPAGDEWSAVHRAGIFDGIAAIQFRLDPDEVYRMKFTALKPYDVKGTFKVRLPDRHDGVVAQAGSPTVSLIIGPQPGCGNEIVPRCIPITVSDVGWAQMRLDMERADTTSFGMVSLYPFDEGDEPPVRLSLKYKDSVIECGSNVKKGWWIFARSIQADADPLDTMSLCVRDPDGDWKCADDRDHELKRKASQKGRYVFTAWSKLMRPSVCEVIAE